MSTQGQVLANGDNPVLTEGLELAKTKWNKYITGLTEGYKKKHNVEPPANIISTTAIMLENTQKMIQQMDETTRVVNLGNFVDYGFGIITAVMPSLVANEIVSVQPLKGRSGEIFYLDFKYGSNKGAIKAGGSMFNPFTGMDSSTYNYSAEEVEGEDLGTIGAADTSSEGTLSYYPIQPGTVSLELGTTSITDDGAGKFVSEVAGVSGTIDYATGAYTLKFTAPGAEATLAAGYKFSYGNMDVHGSIPTVDIDLKSKTISTVTRSLAARWLFDAAFELQASHGVSADEEISSAMASEIRHGIDQEIMHDLLIQGKAGNQVFSWSNTPATGVSYKDHKDSFVDTIIKMSNAIFTDTKRAEGNFIIAGTDASSIIESLGDRFKPVVDGVKAGPHVIGTLDGRWKVIKNPFYPAAVFVVGYKGTSYLEGGDRKSVV